MSPCTPLVGPSPPFGPQPRAPWCAAPPRHGARAGTVRRSLRSQAGTRPHRSSSVSSTACIPKGGTFLTTACCASGSWGRASCTAVSSESA
eukprot:3978829-Heterocapsa_arctica.AAC.1